MTVHALVVAAGRGTRAGPGGPKQWRLLGGAPVLRRSVEAMLACSGVNRVRVVIHPDDEAAYHAAVAGLPLDPPIHGGATRQQSVRLGLEAIDGADDDLVLIHDAARPFADTAMIGKVLAALGAVPGACPALPVADTLRRDEGGFAGEGVDRAGLSRAQTPQGFRLGPIRAAHRAALGRELTDDVAVARAAGLAVALTPGSEGNVKLTTAEDFAVAESRLATFAAQDARMQRLIEHRTGAGFDVHAFEDGDAVILCGVAIPHPRRLKGHSDADVAMHALTDAIFGALAEGDIGTWFPPSDPQWRGAASEIFLARAVERVAARGGRIVHVDVTVICERPKIGPHAAAMRARLAAILGIAVSRVSVKATTTERLGFAGREEGIAAQAAATLALPAPPDDEPEGALAEALQTDHPATDAAETRA